MTQGLQVWDASGNLILDTSYDTGFILGVVDFATAAQSGSLTDANFANGTPFFFDIGTIANMLSAPTVTYSGTTMTWTATDGTYSGKIYYGYY